MSPALSFSCENKKQDLVNKKCSQTIRPKRKNPIEVGDRLYIYWKQRVSPEHKDYHKLGEGRVTEISDLIFFWNQGTEKIDLVGNFPDPNYKIMAEKDGFKNLEEMLDWFEYRYGDELFDTDFKIIRWDWF